MRKENFTNKRWTKLLAFVLAALTAFAVFPIMAAEKAVAASETKVTFELTEGVAFHDANFANFYFAYEDGAVVCDVKDSSGELSPAESGSSTVTIAGTKYKVTTQEGETNKVELTATGSVRSTPFTFCATSTGSQPLEVSLNQNSESDKLLGTVAADDTVSFSFSAKDNASVIKAKVVAPKFNVNLPDGNAQYTIPDLDDYTVAENSQFQFTVLVNPGYKPTVNYRMGSAAKSSSLEPEDGHTDKNGKWEYTFKLPEATADITVTSISVDITTVKVTVTGLKDENHFEHNLTGRDEEGGLVRDIPYGSDFSFNLSPYPGYQAPLITVTQPKSALVTRVGTLYTVANITEDTTISIGIPESEEYTVTFTQRGTGFTASASSNGGGATSGNTLTVKNNDTVTFTVTTQEAYSKSHVTVKANNVVQTEDGSSSGNEHKYKIVITGNTDITVDPLEINTYTVTYSGQPSEHFSTTLATRTVNHGDSISFTVTPAEGYEAPEVNVSKGQDKLKVSSNNYTLSDITDDIVVTINEPSLRTFTVTAHEDDAYTIEVTKNGGQKVTPEERVEYGTNITIKVTPNAAYTNSTVAVTIGGTSVKMNKDGSGDTWTGTHVVKGNVEIFVGALTQNTYTVTLPKSTTKYDVSSTQVTSVSHGQQFVFTVELKDGYKYTGSDPKNIITGLDEGVDYSVATEDNIFTVTVSSVTKNLSNIKVNDANVTLITYKVKWTDSENFEISGNSTTVNYNTGLTFTVKPNTGYKITGVTYKIGEAVNPLSAINGNDPSSVQYTLPAITANVDSVEVTVAVAPIVVTVNYSYENITMANQVLYAAGAVSREYSINSGDGHVLNVEDGKLTLTLPALTQDDFVAEKWMSDNATVAGDKLEITGNLNSDRVVIVRANWKVDTTLVEETVKFGAVDHSTETTEKAVVGTWETKFELSTDPRIAEVLNRGTVTGFGFIYSKSDFNSKLDDSNFADWLGGISSTTEREGVYATFNSVNNDPFVNGMVFRQRMSFTKGQDMPTVYGAFYVRVNVAGTTYVIVSGIASIDFNVAAGQIALPTKVGED